MTAPSFTCTVCQRDVSMRWWVRRDAWSHQAPLCIVCERGYGVKKMPPFGTFRDRRMASQILALSNALESEARRSSFFPEYNLGSGYDAARL